MAALPAEALLDLFDVESADQLVSLLTTNKNRCSEFGIRWAEYESPRLAILSRNAGPPKSRSVDVGGDQWRSRGNVSVNFSSARQVT